MKKFALMLLVACVAFVTVGATTSHAQAVMKADVPFEFSAGYGVLPAGEYTIARTGMAPVLSLLAEQRGRELIMPETTDSWERVDTPKLVFHRYGSEYFLAEIWSSADGTVRRLAVHAREKQLAQSGVSQVVAVVYANAVSAAGK
jgi:hypothetical protein